MDILFTIEKLESFSIHALRSIASDLRVSSPTTKKKSELIEAIMKIQNGQLSPETGTKKGRPRLNSNTVSADETLTSEDVNHDAYDLSSRTSSRSKVRETAEVDYSTPEPEQNEIREGVLEIINNENYGFIRSKIGKDAYISANQIKVFRLKSGDHIKGETRASGDKNTPPIGKILEINFLPPIENTKKVAFESLTPIFPNERIELARDSKDYTLRLIDLLAPIGKGQRSLIVSPPKAGKTTILKQLAQAIESKYPQILLFVLLIDERPEEVTDFEKSIHSEVIASTFDHDPANHIKKAEQTLARAKSMVESGYDVVILLDSITRLTRAYNTKLEHSGKTLSGGLDTQSLLFPKQFFGAARNLENGASLTIIATALIETNSRMDEVIYEEFKGTGNMELLLDRKLSERRIFPAIDIAKSGTRRDELLLSPDELEASRDIRRILTDPDATEKLITLLTATQDNDEFVSKILSANKKQNRI